ncbi:MAG TPA: SUF system NifU family Fe-S cluster assembly protein [Gemmatimonadaceae bacterium]
MPADLTELYQSIILDHNRAPRNFRAMDGDARRAEGRNPLCGDHLTVWLRLDGERIEDASFLGQGCAISKASASVMTAAVKGKTRGEAEALFARFHDLVTGHAPPADAGGRDAIAAFGGVSRFPVRVKCASLAWHAMRAALGSADAAGEGAPAAVSTE